MSLFSKVAKFASSPQGRAALDKAKNAANDPKNRAKIDDLVNKVKERGRGSSAGPSAQPTQPTRPIDPTPGSPTPGSQP
ncbi:MAG: hypothetical protein H7323_14830 [Frankiales bacterium]|nr:hypothetical protein [Frankiales bacterium]